MLSVCLSVPALYRRDELNEGSSGGVRVQELPSETVAVDIGQDLAKDLPPKVRAGSFLYVHG